MTKPSLIIDLFRASAVRGLLAAIARGSLALAWLFSAVLLSGCTALTAESVKSRVANRGAGAYINGRESIQETGVAYITAKDPGITVTEFDGKPFFWEQKSRMGLVSVYGPYEKRASPVALGRGGILVMRPGAHTLKLKYELFNESLLFPSTKRSKDETIVEFVAEKDHAYLITPHLSSGKTADAFWHPTISELEAR